MGLACCVVLSCQKMLGDQVPQGTLSDEQVKSPANAEAMVVSAYAIFTTAEDINSSFSMWNFDVRSDDAYKGGSGVGDGDVFHQLEMQQGAAVIGRLLPQLAHYEQAQSAPAALEPSFEPGA